MNKFASIKNLPRYPTWAVVILFILIGVICFGLLIPYLGFFWDDYPLAWIAETYGNVGLERYFSTNRPFWGMLFQITTPILGSIPWHWQVFGLTWRVLLAISFWILIRLIWPERPTTALFASMAFLVYPGFTQQWISIIYSHFFIIMTAFISSLVFNVLAVRAVNQSGNSRKSLFYTVIALFLSLINLISLEYFLTLELIRPFILWIVLGNFTGERKDHIQKTLKIWFPYLFLWTGIVVWRFFLFPYQTTNYQLSLLDRFYTEPIWAFLSLIQNISTSLWRVGILPWLRIFLPPDHVEVGRLTTVFIYFLVIVVFLVILSWFIFLRVRSKEITSIKGVEDTHSTNVLWLSILALFLAGWPFWLIDISPSLNFSLDRFTLPFMFGSALLVTSLVQIFQINFVWKVFIISILISFSVGTHFKLVNAYRRDWETQKRFFWQLVWRIPNLKSGTTVLSNELPLTYYSDNSLTAPLNWIYDPDNDSEMMSYLLAYPARRLGSSLPDLKVNQPFEVDYLAATFIGNTSQVITIYYNPPACLRVLDENLDVVNHMLPLQMQESATLSSFDNILMEPISHQTTPLEVILAPEEEHGWCYYYQKAELARQQGDWEEVVQLAERAFALGDYPNDPAERLPYIEGYAHTGKWKEAVQQTGDSLRVSSKMIPVLCLIWRRIESGTIQSIERDEAIESIHALLRCSE